MPERDPSDASPSTPSGTRDAQETRDAPGAPEGKLDALARGLRARTWPTAKLATKLSVAMARRTFLGESDDKPVDAARAVEAATELVAQMGQLKGIVMKFGQMASYLPGAMPAEAQRVLATLQSQSVAMSYERIAEVVGAELGGAPHEVFEHFEREPLAAASIGQVHRARFEGRDVAVKIQYPGIDALLAGDLDTIGLFAKLGSIGTPVDGAALVDELRDRTLEECDYANEARNQLLFRRILSSYDGCRVPDVVAARSTKRVLTTELVTDAIGFAELVARGDRATLDRAGARIFESAFESIFRHCAFNADPHPGNYLFHDDGDVTFLDYGCVRRFDRDFIDAWKRFARAVQDEDYGAFRRHFPELGMLPNAKGFDWEYQWEAMKHLYLPMRSRSPHFTFDAKYVEESYGRQVFDNPNKLRVAMPREFLLANRLQWGLFAVLASMGATAPWPDLFRAAIESPTTPA